MAAKATLSDLRNAIEAINREVMKEQGNGEASNATVLDRVMKTHAKEVELLTPQLVGIALTKLLNEVSSRKRPSANFPEGIDLFGAYRGIPKSVSIVRGKKKDTAKLKFAEVDLWLKTHSEKIRDPKYDDFRRLVEDCRPYKISEEDTLEMAMERKRQAERNLL